MSDVLDYFRQKDPRFKDVPDEDLTLYIASRKPEFLKNEGFKKDFGDVMAKKGVELAELGQNTADFVLRHLAIGREVGRQMQEKEDTALEAGLEEQQRLAETAQGMISSPAAIAASAAGQEEIRAAERAALPKRGTGGTRFSPAVASAAEKTAPGPPAGYPLAGFRTVMGKLNEAVAPVVSDFLARTGIDPASTPEHVINLPEWTKEQAYQFGQTLQAADPMMGKLIQLFPSLSAGLEQIAAGTAAGFAQPENALLIPFLGGETAVSKAASIIFGMDQFSALPDEIKEAITVLKDPKSTAEQKVKAVGMPGVSTLLGATMLKHGTEVHAPAPAATLKIAADQAAKSGAPATAAAIRAQVPKPAADDPRVLGWARLMDALNNLIGAAKGVREHQPWVQAAKAARAAQAATVHAPPPVPGTTPAAPSKEQEGAPSAIQQKPTETIRDVLKPEDQEKGEGQVPKDEGRKEDAEGRAKVATASDVSKMSPEEFRNFRDVLGKGYEAKQDEVAKSTPVGELKSLKAEAEKEATAAKKAVDDADYEADPEGAADALQKYQDAAGKVQFFSETLKKATKPEAPVEAPKEKEKPVEKPAAKPAAVEGVPPGGKEEDKVGPRGPTRIEDYVRVADAGDIKGVDAGIAGLIEDLNKAGYKTTQSMSGLKEDYPTGERYHPDGYIAWWEKDISKDQIEKIRAAAKKAGLYFDDQGLTFFQPSVEVRVGMLKSGKHRFDLHDQADKMATDQLIESGKLKPEDLAPTSGQIVTRRIHKLPSGQKFTEWLELRDKILRDLEEKEGGVISDDEIKAKWEAFYDALLGEKPAEKGAIAESTDHYKLEQKGETWMVTSHDGAGEAGPFATKEEASKAMLSLESSFEKPAAPTKTTPAAEPRKAGELEGLTEAELDKMLEEAVAPKAKPEAKPKPKKQYKNYTVRLSFEFPAWDEKEGIPFEIEAETKAEAIKRARQEAYNAGHLAGGKGRVTFKVVGEEGPEEVVTETPPPVNEHIQTLYNPEATEHETGAALVELMNAEKAEDFIPSAQNNLRIGIGKSMAYQFDSLYKKGVKPGADVSYLGKNWNVKRFEIDEKNIALKALIQDEGGTQKLVKVNDLKPMEKPEAPPKAPEPKKASDAIANAAKFGVKGIDEAVKGLNDLFGGGFAMGGPPFNEKTYAMAKPHFEAAYKNFKEAGKSLGEFFQYVFQQWGDRVKPYIRKFILDKQVEQQWIDKQRKEAEARKEAADADKLEPTGGKPGGKGIEPIRPTAEAATEAGKPGVAPGVGGKGKPEGVPPGAAGGREEGVGGTGGAGAGRKPVTGEGPERPPGELQPEGAKPGGRKPGEGQFGVRSEGVAGPEKPVKHEATPAEKTPANSGNHVITDLEEFERGGAKTKFRQNVDAIKTLRKVMEEGRPATPEEQAILARYVGWGRSEFSEGLFGDDWDERYPESEVSKWKKEREELIGLIGKDEFNSARKSTLNAHYTTPKMAVALWRMLSRMGFRGGRINEPAIGVGVFYGTMPGDIAKRSSLVGGDMDILSANIAKHLYPGAKITNAPFQETPLPDNWFDLQISNVPFGDIAIRSDKYNKYNAPLHDYFFLKAVQTVRPGGLVTFITSTGTMDKANSLFRKEIAKHADLIAAFRLPDGAFQKGAGTAVVTDVMILRRRAEGEAPSGPNWMERAELPDPAWPKNPIPINEYYAAHPENILGTLDTKSRLYGSGNSHVSMTDDFEQRLEKAIASLPEDAYKKAITAAVPPKEKLADANTKTKNFGYQIEGDKLWQLVDGKLIPQEVGKDRLKQSKALLALRDEAQKLITAELTEKGDEVPNAQRAVLNKVYQDYFKKYGSIHSAKAGKFLIDDPDWPVMLSLEKYDPDSKAVAPADILSKRTINPTIVKERAENAPEAVGISLNEFGELNSQRIGSLLGISPEEAEQRIVNEGLGFRLPEGGVALADHYLSGNVREKLVQAEAAASLDPKFNANVDALRKVIPEDLPHSEIEVRLGSPWVEPTDYMKFFSELLGAQEGDLQVSLIRQSGKWVIEHKSEQSKKRLWKNAAFVELYGSPKADFLAIARAAMDDKPIAIYTKDADDKRVYDAENSAAANLKVDAVREAFKEWVWKEDERRERLTRYYNDNFNNIVQAKHDGSWLQFPDLNRAAYPFGPYAHQLSAVARMIATRRAFLAHEVGTGKTLSYGLMARKAKQLGFAHKPALVVLKRNIEQITDEIQRAFPTMKILSTSEQFDAENRQKTIARIATGDWDLVVMTHDNFNMLDVDKDVERKFINEEIAELEAAIQARQASTEGVQTSRGSKEDLTTKQLEKMKERLREKLADALNRPRDPAISFQKLGVDMLMVDEAQAYKSLPVYTSRGSVKGIPQSRSERATNMQMHLRWLQENNPKAIAVMGSGTPIDNSMVELYNWQRLLQPEELAKRGIGSFDAWANTFGQTVTTVEPTAAGEFKPTTRFKRFTNLPELSALSRQMMDVKFVSDMPNVNRPKKIESVEKVAMSELQTRYMESLAVRAQNLRRDTMKEDNMLLICTDGRKLALHPGLVNPEWVNEKNTKIDLAISNVLKYHKAEPGVTQMIFSDLGVNPTPWGFHLYKYIINELVRGGIPKDKIIDFSKLKEGEETLSAIRRLRNADALVGIGSTSKMGTGVNAQQHLKYLHNVDAPMTPGRLTQRDGRGWRQGNKNTEIGAIRYVTEGSLDAFTWSLINNKATFIDQVLRQGLKQREVEEVDSEELSPARVMAEATGNPDVINSVELQDKVTKLQMQQRIHERESGRRQMIMDRYNRELKDSQETHARISKDVASAKEAKEKNLPVEIEGKQFKELDKNLEGVLDKKLEEVNSLAESSVENYGAGNQFSHIAKIGDFEIGARYWRQNRDTPAYPSFYLKGNGEYNVSITEAMESRNSLSLIRSALAVMRNLPGHLERAAEAIKTHESNIEKLKPQLGKEWPHAQELLSTKQELAATLTRLQARTKSKADLAVKISVAEERVESELGQASLKALQESRTDNKLTEEQYLESLNKAVSVGGVQKRSNEFHIRTGSGPYAEWRKVTGKRVEVPGWESYEFFGRKNEKRKEYAITNIKTGLAVGHGATMEEAIKNARQHLDSLGREQVEKIIKSSVDQYGESPSTKPPEHPDPEAESGEGPGTPAVGQGPDPKAQIEQLEESFRNIKGKKPSMLQQVKEAFNLGKALSAAQDRASQAVSGLKTGGDSLIDKWEGYSTMDAMLKAKGELSAEIEKRGWRIREFEKTVRKAIPDPRDQAAIAKWVDAGGDLTRLQDGYAEAPAEYKQAYLDAMSLTGDLKTAAENIRYYFESRLQEAIDAGVLEDGIEDYIHRIYERDPAKAKKLTDYVRSQLLDPNPSLARQRIFTFDWEAEKLGYRPVQSFIPRIIHYETSLSKAIASRKFIARLIGYETPAGKKVAGIKAKDGRPVISVGGMGTPVTGAVGNDAILIKPSFKPENRKDYVPREYPQLRRWKWATEDSLGNPIYVQGDLIIHPDEVHRIDAMLEKSKVRYGRYGKVGRAALGVSSTVKQTMLDFSGFHNVQVLVHGLEHKVMPWKLMKNIDFSHPDVDGLLKGGVTLGGEYSGYKLGEGLVGSSISRAIPGLNTLLETYHGWLFQSLIPRLKMTMAMNALQRNKLRFEEEVVNGKMGLDEVYHITANQANAAFGELNYLMLERSATWRDISRLILLAPDFLEARGRFALQGMQKGGAMLKTPEITLPGGKKIPGLRIPGTGNEQRMALLLGAATMYIVARVANKLLDDQYHFEPENIFSVVYKGKAIGLRTVQGDILHLIEEPLQFWMSRLNPVFGRNMLEMVTQRDYFGRKRTRAEQLWDAVKTTIPITLRGLTEGRERKLWESLANGFGMTVRRWSQVDDAFKMAQKWKDEHGVKLRGEFIYDPTKDDLRPLKIVLSEGDEAGAIKEITKLIAGGMDETQLDKYFKRYRSMPFTGSKANDEKFMETLSDDQKKTVEAAIEQKEAVYNLYDRAMGLYQSALRQDPRKVFEDTRGSGK